MRINQDHFRFTNQRPRILPESALASCLTRMFAKSGPAVFLIKVRALVDVNCLTTPYASVVRAELAYFYRVMRRLTTALKDLKL